MVTVYEKDIQEEIIRNFSRDILEWYKGNEQFLNIIAPPYGLSSVLIGVIINLIKKGQKVLYVTNEEEDKIGIIEMLKKNTEFRNYAYYRDGGHYRDVALLVCNFDNISRTSGEFKLIIMDESRAYPKYTKHQILNIIDNTYRKDAKYIYFSLECLFDNLREIILPVRENGIPIFEPRIITTRIDLNKDIPYVAFDYIKWSVNSKKNLIIYVPDEEKVFSVKKYFETYKEGLSKHIIYNLSRDNDERIAQKFLMLKDSILITDDFVTDYTYSKNCNIMVFFADDVVYNYKGLVHFCGRTERRKDVNGSEVIFLSNTVSYDMEIAKDITRYFNKEAWEMGLLKI